VSGDVERGDKIAIEVSSGGARLTFDAMAESSGHAGDSIMVRNPESGRLFRAKVEGKGRASVTK
jgi:flagella basal body P-ring formation protein FlgA